MRPVYLLLPLVTLLSCTTTPKAPGDPQAVRDYVEVGELEDVEHIRTFSRDSMEYVSDYHICLLYTSPSPRDATLSRMPSSA